ncbi:MAG: hypothetical protein LBC96_10295 [Lachnospiraceae bacterium]|jgi:hypothetical protein|nr:hypothetical protein [Lachnospiraceae bacterium]
MILFMLRRRVPPAPPDTRYAILSTYQGEELKEKNVFFVSWNQINFVQPGKPILPITNLNELIAAVFSCAEIDPVCIDMNRQFLNQYGIDIFAVYRSRDPQYIELINDVFDAWAHPMIGNVLVSSGVRPQTLGSQYIMNWDSFPEAYMTLATKKIIEEMIRNPASVELKKLEKSSRDQVRICRDMTELARAVMGEITTCATKRLEKIYALEFCLSEQLLLAQRHLISIIIHTNFDNITVGKQTLSGLITFHELFLVQEKIREREPLSVTEYLHFYFPSLSTLDIDMQWTALVTLIECALGVASDLEYIPATGKPQKIIDESITIFKRLPPPIRCAIIINDIRKFEDTKTINRYSMAAPLDTFKPGVTHDFVIRCDITEASTRHFIPTLVIATNRGKTKNSLLWNWMRDEKHIATMTYRHYLLPLWGGPSGHTTGLIDFYSRHLGRAGRRTATIPVDGKQISISAIIISTMFTFWRLYYDKRINAVHTLVETFEGAYSSILCEGKKLDDEQKSNINSFFRHEETLIEKPELPTYDDPFETLESTLPPTPYPNAWTNPARIMAQIKKKHYKTLPHLKDAINLLRSLLSSQGFEVPRWSKPITYEPDSLAARESGYSGAFTGVTVRSFTQLNVKTFGDKPSDKFFFAITPPTKSTKRLATLYANISSSLCHYNFSQDFANLPHCVIGDQIRPLLADITFTDIDGLTLGETLVFDATATTASPLWENIKAIIPLKDSERFHITISDDGEKLDFSACLNINFSFKINERLSFIISNVVIHSGLNNNSPSPHIKLISHIAATQTLELSMIISLCDKHIHIYGEYEDGKVLTMKELLTLLGVDDVIPIAAILPAEESIFGSLGLRNLSITIRENTISSLDFTITASHPWTIYGDKITVHPYFDIKIVYPFDNQKRQIEYTVLGKWTLATTVFDLMFSSEQIIIAQLADGSNLDFAKVADVFAINVNLPAIKLTDMELVVDLAHNDYSLTLSATDVMSFPVGGALLAIEDIHFALDFRDSTFGDLALAGSLRLGGLSFHLHGKYDADGSFEFDAMAHSDLDYSLRDLILNLESTLIVNAIASVMEISEADYSSAIDTVSNPAAFTLSAFPLDFLSANIRTLCLSYQSKDSAFTAFADFENVLNISDRFTIDRFALRITSIANQPLEFTVIAAVTICETAISLVMIKENDDFIIKGSIAPIGLNFGNIAAELGIDIANLPAFIGDFAISDISIEYVVNQKAFLLSTTTNIGTVTAAINANDGFEWRISYQTTPAMKINMLDMPLAGELVKKISPDSPDFSVSNFKITASNTDGVSLSCLAFGELFTLNIYAPIPQECLLASTDEFTDIDLDKGTVVSTSGDAKPTVKWLELGKTFAVLTIPKVGIGVEGKRILLLLDASLNVSPLTFSLLEAGVGIDITDLANPTFYLSGFGIAFDNGTLAIGGSFMRGNEAGKDVYSGTLLFKFKSINAAAVGQYSDGSMMAYLALTAAIGGPPAFFVTGLAAGFGYNKRLLLPQVENVPEFPLIKAATNGFDPQITAELNRHVITEKKQCFLAAGVKFTSFRLVNGFMLFIVSFGNDTEIGALGIAKISVPPNTTANPVAKAELAMKAYINPHVGVLGVEARLTSESYILSRDAKLSGGFAAFFWFGENIHSGDFVITLGGYHPAYQKPDHYPVVPRLALNWNVSANINISGELYFALTPNTLMAGGKLCAIYIAGNLRAWFVAYADFLIMWKPFSYDVKIGVCVGASYRIKWWFVNKTFSVELAAALHLWGPEMQGSVRITWYIISFTISFSKGADYSRNTLTWEEFKNSFLLSDTSQNTTPMGSAIGADILSLTMAGLIGKTRDGTDIISPYGLVISLSSKIPESGNIRPVNNAPLSSRIELKVERNGVAINDKFMKNTLTQNLPAALWKKAPASSERLKEERLLNNAVCGLTFTLNQAADPPPLFPVSRYISLLELYKNNTMILSDSFVFAPEKKMVLCDDDSLPRFSQTANSSAMKQRRREYLSTQGITADVDIALLAMDAEDWFSEDIIHRTA